MTAIPHFALDFDFVGGKALVTEQDTEAEVADCVAAILSFPRGSRRQIPDFGVDEQAFRQGGADLDEIREAITTYEPRALAVLSIEDDAALVALLSEVRADLTLTGG